MAPIGGASRRPGRTFSSLKVSRVGMAAKVSRVAGFLPIGASTACFKRERGFRFVVPYLDSSSGVVRERWVGRRIDEGLGSELPVSRETLAAMFQAGRIRLDGQPVAQSHIMRRQERYRVDFHRHEPEACSTEHPAHARVQHALHAPRTRPAHAPQVLDEDVEVLHESEQMVAVLKPASLPVHPAGRFRKNTVLGVLEASRPDLFSPVELAVRSVHRLDRQVSGVLLLGRGRRGAKKLSADLRGGRLLKEYIARVRGVFPPGERHVHAPIGVLDEAGLVFSCAPGMVGAREAHTIVSRERVVCGEDGELESLVRCVAVTNPNQTPDPNPDY